MEFVIMFAAGFALFAVLGFFLRAASDRREIASAAFPQSSGERLNEQGSLEPASGSAVRRIFASSDAEFVSKCRNKALLSFFHQERKSIALRWIGRQRLQATAIVHEHLRNSRVSQDLQLAGEVKLLARYFCLRLLCEFLSLAVHFVGPQKLHSVAGYAGGTFQGLRKFMESMENGSSATHA